MDLVSFNITREDLVGALRTITLFLENLSFNQTSAALRAECTVKGYNEIVTMPQKITIRTPPDVADKKNYAQENKSNQTEKYFEDEGSSFVLESTMKRDNDLVFYYKEPHKSYEMSSKEIVITLDDHPKAKTEQSCQSVSRKKSLKLNNINFLKSDEEEESKSNQSFLKSQSDPLLHLNSTGDSSQKRTKVDTNFRSRPNKMDSRKLKYKLRKLEVEHQKLMGVTTELTAALQTHILGQSENLNTTLNKCKSIYPELFHRNTDPFLELTDSSSSEGTKPLSFTEEITKFKESSSAAEKLEESLPLTNSNTTTIGLIDEIKTPGDSEESSMRKIEATDQQKSETKEVVWSCHKLADLSAESPLNISKPLSGKSTYFELDYKKLKQDLRNGDNELKMALVQALRKRILRSTSDVRAQIMNSYIRNDLLELQPTSTSSVKSIVEIYFIPNLETPHPLQDVMSQFLNALASLTLGRDYLCQHEHVLTTLLIPILKGTDFPNVFIDEITRDMLIASVQKLSLRHKQRESMIDAGFTEHMLTFLSEQHSNASQYCMEYATALFMNLCLHRKARERLHSSATVVVNLMAKLLSPKYDFCMPYVNGAMYSLLSDPLINQEARRMNFSQLIDSQIKETDGEVRTELEHILRLHLEGAPEHECDCDSTIEPEFEVDILEPELDSGDLSTHSKEDILSSYKVTVAAPCSTPTNLRRPVTPRSKSANEQRPTHMFPQTVESNEMSFCEETKQYYHAPSKNGIFESQQTKQLHRIPPSFTKTIPMHQKEDNSMNGCYPQFYVRPKPFIPEENSSARNPPYSLDYPVHYRTCYRDNWNRMCNHNKYSCGCYNQMSRTMDLVVEDNRNNNENEAKENLANAHFCPNCTFKNGSVLLANFNKSNKATSVQSPVADSGVVDFSLKELSNTINSVERHVCPTKGDCRCYDVVFQSRPKLLRTPP